MTDENPTARDADGPPDPHAALVHLDAAGRRAAYDEARRRGADLAVLQQLDAAALRRSIAADGLEVPTGLSHREATLALAVHRLQQGLGTGEGVLEVMPEGFGFLRQARWDFEAGPDDVYLSPHQLRRLELRSGQRLAGAVRAPRRSERFVAMVHVETVDGRDAEDRAGAIPFAERTPILPHVPLRFAAEAADRAAEGTDDLGPDAVQLVARLAPWGRGQRVLVQAPPPDHGAAMLRRFTAAVSLAEQDVDVSVCLLDERPEEIAEWRRVLAGRSRCEVVGAAFDQPPARQVALAEMTLQRCQRRAEAGRDVVLVLHSLTALARACAQDLPPSGRLLGGGLDVAALRAPKRLFAAARCFDGPGSLTVLASVRTGTSSPRDATVFEEFAGKANSEVVLDGDLAARGLQPPLDVLATATRREDVLLPTAAATALRELRNRLAKLPATERLAALRAAIRA